MKMIAIIVSQQSLIYGADFADTLLMLLNGGGLGGGAIGAAAPKIFRYAECDKDAFVWFTASTTNRLRVS